VGPGKTSPKERASTTTRSLRRERDDPENLKKPQKHVRQTRGRCQPPEHHQTRDGRSAENQKRGKKSDGKGPKKRKTVKRTS